ncbi:hypothetical protein K431DRAFT_285314 [Polychaeton citri CBS 116435]|uniref:Rab-GAP TBC domain-containing protein n=1 Tax=Polychaeton citri CBS 116435 TaxID=1314669 RepID=A0A9P4QA74_9PEZI|nr:hypothetical protein K431DRAFT_285314 [Polychaeton citri CBS 116435]
MAYEDAPERTPPLAVTTINQARLPNTTSKPTAFSRRPQTSPGPRPADRESYLSSEVKRDSGFAPSLSTAGRASYAESHQESSGLARVPSLPTIQHQEVDQPLTGSLPGRSRFARRSGQENSTAMRSQSNSPPAVKRITSFKGIDTSIPTGDAFDEWMSDKVKFSNRGSLLFGGKRMAELLQSQPEESGSQYGSAVGKEGETPKVLHGGEDVIEARGTVAAEKPPPVPAKDEGRVALDPDQSPPTPRRLVAGRRKPSVQMLQAAIQGGRVLSAEEISFSLKVRSMYEFGDEKAADWTTNPLNSKTQAPPDLSRGSAGIPDVSIDGTLAAKGTSRSPIGEHPALRSPTSAQFSKIYDRQPHELAGGIEDWEDVEGQDVDRYGFINAKRTASAASEPISRDGPHRVATALRLEASQPRGHRKLNRGPSVSRSSRSLPPRKSRRNSGNGTISSAHSTQSNGRSLNKRPLFRSKDQKITEDAGDMLHPPPGFEDVKDEDSRDAVRLRRREREREDKWQSMAQACGQAKKGQLVHYTFNADDPKLIERVWKGIPDRWRASAWHSFLTTSAKRRGDHAPDEVLAVTFHELQEESCADDVQIDVDVPRTISMHIMFRRRYRGGQRLLFRVLHAVSLYFPDTGYVQGMASLAATLLCYYDEERAFIMMVRLWQLRGLDQLFQTGFAGLMAALNDFEKEWLRTGEVANKLQELGITSMTYGTRWYLTLFNLSIPFPAQLRVWDVFMLLGDAMPGVCAEKGEEDSFGGADLDVLHATSAALIDATRDIVLDADFENVMKVLTSFIPIKDEDLLMRVTKAEYKMRKKRAGVKI